RYNIGLRTEASFGRFTHVWNIAWSAAVCEKAPGKPAGTAHISEGRKIYQSCNCCESHLAYYPVVNQRMHAKAMLHYSVHEKRSFLYKKIFIAENVAFQGIFTLYSSQETLVFFLVEVGFMEQESRRSANRLDSDSASKELHILSLQRCTAGPIMAIE
ncbi:hypothetical protein ACJX0J_032224, partial [Zea mays]